MFATGRVKQCPEVYINVSTPFISGDIVALILDTPFADLVVGNYVNTSVPHSIEEVPVTGGSFILLLLSRSSLNCIKRNCLF
jgi:hypothetical protein